MEELSPDFAEEVRHTWHRFLQRTEPHRPDLHRFCRSLTGSVWDAEDLVQDTLLRAFAKLGEFSNPIDNPKAYLFRIASNLWIDRFRRGEPVVLDQRAMGSPEQTTAVRDAAKQLMQLLPPRERAAVVLKDVFDFRLDEIATILQTTVGAIKAALHRGRDKLAAPLSHRSSAGPSEALLDQFVEAFNARDLDRLAALLQEDAVAETVGMGTSHGREPIRNSSFYYCLFLEKGDPVAERREFLGEQIVVLSYADLDDPSKRAVREVFRFEEIEGRIARLCYYGFCPETEAEITGALGLPFEPLGYGVWSPEFLSLRNEEEFLRWQASQHPEWVDKESN
ncbi:MAG TPA: sigma-70 family RNA polymerase sigma factor [Blastocatellia bacterium]|nr:sigma-70 family RNA polymerase sigma factor [Blastocatellia bacterium]